MFTKINHFYNALFFSSSFQLFFHSLYHKVIDLFTWQKVHIKLKGKNKQICSEVRLHGFKSQFHSLCVTLTNCSVPQFPHLKMGITIVPNSEGAVRIQQAFKKSFHSFFFMYIPLLEYSLAIYYIVTHQIYLLNE